MTTHAVSTFKISSWDEKTYEEMADGKKLNRSSVKYAYQGAIEGESQGESLMFYPNQNSASFVGLERITGSIGGRSGSFVIQGVGTYDGTTARADCTIAPNSGTGELQGIHGKGTMAAEHGPSGTLTLDYDFE
jgi:hypothetical protein